MITLLLLLTTQLCHAHVHTLAEADTIIFILVFILIVLLVLGGLGLRQSRIIRQRNEQLRRILNALDDYRAIAGDGGLSLDDQEEMVKCYRQRRRRRPRRPKWMRNMPSS